METELDYNIGSIVKGVVVDIDVKHGKDGRQPLCELRRALWHSGCANPLRRLPLPLCRR